MDVHEAIAKRFSCRSFEDRPIEPDKLERVLDAGRRAPSGCNRQPWKFVVVRDSSRREALAKIANHQAFVGQAPAVVVIVGIDSTRTMSCDQPGDPIDCAIAMDHMTLAATAEGLATCWIGAFNQAKCCDLLGVTAPAKVVELLPIGYPACQAGQKSRKSLQDVVCHEHFSL